MAETQISRREKMVVLDVSAVVVGENWTCVGSPAGLFRDPSILPDLRRLRANGLILQRRDRKSNLAIHEERLSYGPVFHHVKQ